MHGQWLLASALFVVLGAQRLRAQADTVAILSAVADTAAVGRRSADRVWIDPRPYPLAQIRGMDARSLPIRAGGTLLAIGRRHSVATAELADCVYRPGCVTPPRTGLVTLSEPVIAGDSARVLVAFRYKNPAAKGTRGDPRSRSAEWVYFLRRSDGLWVVTGSRPARVE